MPKFKKFKVHRKIITGVLFTGALTSFLGTVSNSWVYFGIILIIGIILAPVNVALSGWIDPLMMFAHSLALGIIAVIFPAFFKVGIIYFAIGILLIGVGSYYLITMPKLVRLKKDKNPLQPKVENA